MFDRFCQSWSFLLVVFLDVAEIMNLSSLCLASFLAVALLGDLLWGLEGSASEDFQDKSCLIAGNHFYAEYDKPVRLTGR